MVLSDLSLSAFDDDRCYITWLSGLVISGGAKQSTRTRRRGNGVGRRESKDTGAANPDDGPDASVGEVRNGSSDTDRSEPGPTPSPK
jgi:hypothetical protein